MSKTDSKILILKEQIEKKKKEIAEKKTKVSTITNCSLMVEGCRYNINTLKGDKLQYVLIVVNSLLTSATGLNLQDEFLYDGYFLKDWISDLKSRMEVEQYKIRLKEMTSLEKKLDGLLSEEKQTEIEVDSISDLIKGL